MAKETTYEVQARKGGQWTILESFKDHEKDEALTIAKEIFEEHKDFQSIKVVKEITDQETDEVSESVIFRDVREVIVKTDEDTKGDKDKSFKKGARQDAKKGGKKGGKKTAKNKSPGLSGFAFRFMGGVVFSLVIGGLGAFAATYFLGGTTQFGIHFVGEAKTWLFTGAFAGAFLISISVVAHLLFRKMKAKKPAKKATSKRRRPRKPKMPLFTVAILILKSPFKIFSWIFAISKHQKIINKAIKAEAPQPTEAPEETLIPPEPEEEPLSETDEKLKNYLMSFLKQALDGGKADQATMDNFNRFGASLFLAGASEVLTTQGQMEPRSQINILCDCLLVLGFKKSHALSLAERYEEYLMADSRYMTMFQTGRKAIGVYLSDETAAPRLLDEALDVWNKPKPVEEESGPITVMFANIVQPPEPQEADDDGNAEQLNQLYNRIVEEALAKHAGMEVKRIPGGIMATFSKTSDAIAAAVEMQKNTALANQGDGSLPLQMTIAINAGQPNAEEPDVYGTVVRLTAQMIEKVAADEIFVSQAVKEICTGGGFDMVDRGAFEMPSAEGRLKLFEVLWNRGGDSAKTDATGDNGEAPPPAAEEAEAENPADENPEAQEAP